MPLCMQIIQSHTLKTYAHLSSLTLCALAWRLHGTGRDSNDSPAK